MALFNFRDAVDSLDDLLDRERSAILDGNFDVLGRILKEKERLVAAVLRPETGHRLGPLKAKADRNQSMLLAAAKGIRTVSDRIANRGRDNPSFKTYDRAGHRHPQPKGGGNLERRA